MNLYEQDREKGWKRVGARKLTAKPTVSKATGVSVSRARARLGAVRWWWWSRERSELMMMREEDEMREKEGWGMKLMLTCALLFTSTVFILTWHRTNQLCLYRLSSLDAGDSRFWTPVDWRKRCVVPFTIFRQQLPLTSQSFRQSRSARGF